MRKTLSLLTILIFLIVVVVPMTTNAAPSSQFAGCADEVGESYGFVFAPQALNGLTFDVTAIGVDGFDPAITVKNAAGEVVACNNDSSEAESVAVNLPSVTAGPAESTARVSVTVPGDQGRLNYEVIITGDDNTSGEFVLIYEGAEVFGSDDEDTFNMTVSDASADAEVPLVLYAANLRRPELAIDPEITFEFGEQSQTCSKSSSTSLCAGDHEDLTGYTVTDKDGDDTEMNGDDVMLAYQMGGQGDEYATIVSSYQAASFGAYTLMIHTGVVNPDSPMEDGEMEEDMEATEEAAG